MTELILAEKCWPVPQREFDVYYEKNKVGCIRAHHSEEALEKAREKLSVARLGEVVT
jgi:hypothetical protein